MTNIAPQPSNPSQWQEWYATLDDVLDIPLQAADYVNESSKLATHRGILLDAPTVLDFSMHNLYIYADVLVFPASEITISPAASGIVQILARVLTAAAPITLLIPPGDAATCAISIYAPVLDQPISVRTGDSKPITLELGPTTANVGVILTFSGGEVTADYQKRYPTDNHPELQASLETELRNALSGFWKNSSVGISICAYVAAITHNQKAYSMLNTQAAALGQQLAGRAIAGPNMSYAPTLPLDTYEKTAKLALAAASEFDEEYRNFQDKAESLEIQIQAWKVMLSQAIANQTMRINLRDSAFDKYQSAAKSAASCETQFRYENDAVKSAEIQFQLGIAEWEFNQELKAVFEIFKAVITFAVNIGELCIGDPAAAGGAEKAVDGAVEAVEEAEKITGQIEKIISSITLENLGKAAKALYKLYPSVVQVVDAVKALESNSDTEIPSMGDISGTTEGDADSAAIVTLAAWDVWILESDHQMEFAVKNEIGGASEYQLALRKHAINGKQLAQTQAEAIKAGYEYVQAQMEVIVCAKQVNDLQGLIDEYTGQEDIYLQAKVQLYDRLMALRTGVVIELQNMVWAYRYWALAESTLVLDIMKSVDEYNSDLYTIALAMETIDGQYGSDYQDFGYDHKSEYLPLDFGSLLLEGLTSERHTGSFTLAPEEALAGQFVEGSHYRLSSLDLTLIGARPKSEFLEDGVVKVSLEITTSGIYSDINKDQVFHFASVPSLVRCSYQLNEEGDRGLTLEYPVFKTENHAEPTPFTQWQIKLLHPERVDLSGLTGINLNWKGHVRFDPTRRSKEISMEA
ncbi:hypothetical protein DTO013E5_585 [Penicillium roqueforti]|uniref:Genomic scaffold, ProqFM164S02 n=1 Tax=Penicillium roqueforti (strain FM164) TaxID=1365484 RepID=W6Q9A5_PENRF|nr:uncharacterized protein LCP9604111_554 [Penicillium roqueforti]CDM30769.1 unnamed protein product [Penicillium roqueforti FM164]KAF9253028.1 hypothetical protein LCP9604111_554 [Penicillium roqueforti]KAI1838544.1 hypothetical protein CBS147337_269 [Penicillium roqueforti]KAI2680546.1 hypothetical protein CBS147355_3526 [Penicillium roqueforti]KAI2691065.1 hypothetical protein LCP963914a_1266 [Penicillium roqueforti]